MWTSRLSSSTESEHDEPTPTVSPRLLEVGRVGKAHGLRGEVSVRLVSNRPERMSVGAEFHTEAGILAISHIRGSQDRPLVRFAGIEDRLGAQALQGLCLRAEPLEDSAELWVHDLVGAAVVDQHGTDRGVVACVVANPGGDLLELDDGTLVPLRFMAGTPQGSLIRVDVPEGLFEAR